MHALLGVQQGFDGHTCRFRLTVRGQQAKVLLAIVAARITVLPFINGRQRNIELFNIANKRIDLARLPFRPAIGGERRNPPFTCLLYTSDAADE